MLPSRWTALRSLRPTSSFPSPLWFLYCFFFSFAIIFWWSPLRGFDNFCNDNLLRPSEAVCTLWILSLCSWFLFCLGLMLVSLFRIFFYMHIFLAILLNGRDGRDWVSTWLAWVPMNRTTLTGQTSCVMSHPNFLQLPGNWPNVSCDACNCFALLMLIVVIRIRFLTTSAYK
jgi:hypothetical protein